MPDDDKLLRALDRWESDYSPDRGLAARVRAEGERRREAAFLREEEDSLFAWFRNTLARPGLAAAIAVMFILVGVGASQLFMQGLRPADDEVTLTYRLSIDPLYRLKAVTGVDDIRGSGRQNAAPQVLLTGLGWLQGELDLSQPQYDTIYRLHGDYEKAFDELFVELLESHQAYQELDKRRMSNDVIDYFEVYELLQTQKRLSEESTRLTAELLEKVEAVIEPSQRARYRKLMDNLYPSLAEAGSVKADV